MIRVLLAALAFTFIGSTSFAMKDVYSVHCMDSSSHKITMYFSTTDSNKVLATFAQDEEGWPYAIEFTMATVEEIGTLTLPEGFNMFVGVSADGAGMGLNRYLLLPAKMDPFKFNAFHGGQYADQPIVLEQKISMECF